MFAHCLSASPQPSWIRLSSMRVLSSFVAELIVGSGGD